VNTLVIHVIVVVFVATLIRSSFGFGEALVAVPLLALRMPIQVAAPLAVLVSITIAAGRGRSGLARHSRSQCWLARPRDRGGDTGRALAPHAGR
jgi:uncharacterized membrane protein YfcA